MQTKTMKKLYAVSRIFLVIITFIIFNIMCINEDVSWKIVPFMFALIVFGISYPSSIISRNLISMGDKLEKRLKIVYYVIVLPIILFFLLCVIFVTMYFIFEVLPIHNSFNVALGQGLMFLFLIAVITLCVVVPYFQTLIILVIKHFIKD